MKEIYTYSKIWKIAYPIFLTLLVQNLIQVTSTAFLGHVGEIELGASALAGIYYIVLFMLAFGFSTGSQILIGRRNGEGNFNKIGEIIVHGLWFLFLMALLLFVFTKTCSEQILTRLLSSKNVLHAALEYLDVRIYGIFFASINVMFRAFYVGITRTKVLSMNALVMALTNIFLDYTLIFGNWGFPEMGISGAALAAVISEAISVVFFVTYTLIAVDLKKYGFNLVSLKNLPVVRQILNISLSLMLQYFLSLGTWLFFFLSIEHMGEKPLAVSNIIRSLYMIIALPVFALAATANTLVSNTIGSGRKDDVIPLIWRISRLALMISGAFMLVVFIIPRLVLSVYTSDQLLIDASMPSLMIVLLVLPIISVGNIFFNAVSGTGNTRTALQIEVLTLAIYIAYIFLVVNYLHAPLEVCWLSEHVYASFIMLLSYFYMKKGDWQSRKI